ncbi:adenine deaminase domain protein [Clostridioides difficile DA00165]|nr:adenine deaminase domain protein [Clostridioides difficile DA00165]
MEIVPYQILTNKVYESLPCADGYFVPNKEYSKLCVVERHRMTGNVAIAYEQLLLLWPMILIIL